MITSLLRHWACLTLIVFFLMAGLGGEAMSQAKYPVRAITVICPYGTGGTLDVVTRLSAAYMSEKFGVPVNVVNKAGGNAIPGTLDVLSSSPDGYTLLSESQPCSSMLILFKDLPFKIMNRTFIAIVTNAPMMLLVPASSPWKTLDDLANAIKKSPDTFTWISTGSTSIPAYVVRQFLAAIGVDVLKTREVPGKGGGEQITQVAGGHVNLTALAPASSLPSIKAGAVRALAITSKERIPMLPEVPTTKELGYPSIDAEVWAGFSGPPGIPSPVVDQWNQILKKAQTDPKFTSRFANVGVPLLYRNPSESKELVLKEMEEIKKLWGVK